MEIRAPIITTLGHIDHGKTTLLDSIRGTSVNISEPGQITQHIGASFVPVSTIEKICGELLSKLNIQLTIPGLLFVDTPGHEAFTTLRKRGGSVADLAILVVDINEGFQEQTYESIRILREFKTPFVVAATKIDRIPGWLPKENACFSESFDLQREDVKNELEKKVYMLVSQLAEEGFNSERFDRISDFTKEIAIVPCSGITGEGVPELLMVLAGLAQKFLVDKLQLSERGRGVVLEVKETRGFGITIDVILYDGKLRRGDYVVIGGKPPVVTKIRALLLPPPLKELRVEKEFINVEEVRAAAGVKIAAPNLESVIAGSPILAVESEREIEEAKEIVKEEIESVEFSKDIEGVILKADTLGSLEALIKLTTQKGVPVKKAEVGNVNKEDVIEASNVKDDLRKVIFAFNVKVLEDAEKLAQDLKVKVFSGNIIYRIIEDYEEWCLKERERRIEEKLSQVKRPVRIKVLPGCIFRSSKPCIVGVEVLEGVLKPGCVLMRKDGKIVGTVKEMQKEGRSVEEAKRAEKVAISMEEPVAGRTFKENDLLFSYLSPNDISLLQEVWDRISDEEKELVEKLKALYKKIKRPEEGSI